MVCELETVCVLEKMWRRCEAELFRRNMARGEEGREEDAVFVDPDRFVCVRGCVLQDGRVEKVWVDCCRGCGEGGERVWRGC